MKSDSISSANMRDVLIHLVERLALPGDVRQQALGILRSLSPDAAILEDAVERVARVILEARIRLQDSTQETVAFVGSLSHALGEARQAAEHSLTQLAEDLAAGAALNETLRSELQAVGLAAEESPDLVSLRRAVAMGFQGVLECLRGEEMDAAQRRHELQQAAEDLCERLATLEAQAADRCRQAKSADNAISVDPLTGCPNRLAYLERATVEFDSWQRTGAALGLACLGIDGLAEINGRFGHAAGDQVVRIIAKITGEHLAEKGFLCRHGAGEFVVLLPQTDAEAALAIVEKARKAVQAFRFHAKGERIGISISCGIAHLREGDSVDSAFDRAYQALRLSRARGANRVATERNLAAGDSA